MKQSNHLSVSRTATEKTKCITCVSRRLMMPRERGDQEDASALGQTRIIHASNLLM